MKKIIILGVFMTLTGCAEYQWVKPGADAHQRDVAETECTAKALRELPPDNVISDKYTSHDKKHKTDDTSYSTRDANEQHRDILIKDCMYSKGWTQIEVKN